MCQLHDSGKLKGGAKCFSLKAGSSRSRLCSLPQRGFLQLRDGMMYLLPRSQATLEQAKQLIRSLVKEVASATDHQQRAWELAQLMQTPQSLTYR